MIRTLLETTTDVAAIGGIVLLTLHGGADPTTSTVAIAGLGGYRMRRRGGSDG